MYDDWRSLMEAERLTHPRNERRWSRENNNFSTNRNLNRPYERLNPPHCNASFEITVDLFCLSLQLRNNSLYLVPGRSQATVDLGNSPRYMKLLKDSVRCATLPVDKRITLLLDLHEGITISRSYHTVRIPKKFGTRTAMIYSSTLQGLSPQGFCNQECLHLLL